MSGVGEESIRRITKTQEALMRRWAGVRGPNDQSDIMKNLLISGQVSVFAKVLKQIDKSIYGFYEISCFSQ